MNHQKVGWRVAVVAIVTLIGIIWTVPNFVDTTKFWWPTNNKMVMGLDIQGGLHLVLRVDVNGALKQETTRIAGTIRDELTKELVAARVVNEALEGQLRRRGDPEDLTRQTKRMAAAPLSLSCAMAASALPPVASIGSATITSASSRRGGALK